MTRTKEISKRLEELEKLARENREKYDEFPLTHYLDDKDEKEYNKLIKEYTNISVKK